MKTKLFGTAALSLLLAAPAAYADEFTLDPLHTNARFAIDHLGASTNIGGFFGISDGTLSFDPQQKTGKVDVRIQTDTVNGGTPIFTENLKKNAFITDKYPEIRFQSTKWHFDAKGSVTRVDGNLTMMGKTAPVSLKATKFRCYDNPMNKKYTCGGDF